VREAVVSDAIRPGDRITYRDWQKLARYRTSTVVSTRPNLVVVMVGNRTRQIPRDRIVSVRPREAVNE
jgi:hypothetical protein